MISPRHTPPAIFDTACELLDRWTAISSRSGDLQGLTAAAEAVAEAFSSRGMPTRIRRLPGADEQEEPVVEAALSDDALAGRSPCLLAIGHLDTVLPARTPHWEDDRLIATGSVDMKAGLVALVAALDLVRERGQTPPGDLLVVVVPDEEITGPLTRQAVADRAGIARGLWVLEPGQTTSEGAETLVAGRRGMFHWNLEIAGRSAHAGNAYWTGRSALFAAADFASKARHLASEGAGPTVNPARLVAGEADYVRAPEDHPGLLGGVRQTNVVPDGARLDGEARFLRVAEGAALEQALAALARRVAEEHEVEVHLHVDDPIPPVEPGGKGASLCRQAAALAEEQGWTLEIEEDRGGISFSNFHPSPSSLAVLDGLGPVGGGMHTPDEWVDLRSLDRRIDLLARLLAEAKAPPQSP